MELKKYKLGEIANILVGYPFPSEDFNILGKGVRLVRGMNVSERFLRFGDDTRWWDNLTDDLLPYYLQENDIVIGMDGSKVGKNFALVKKEDLPLILVQRVACIRAKENFCQGYLWQYIASPRFVEYVNTIKTGSSIPHISGKQIANFPIYAPSLDQQSRIASVLSSLDSKISLNRRINAKLETIAKRLYDYWFVQFDFPDENGKPYKSSGGKMVWNDELKREIPEGWEVKSVAETIECDISGDWGEEEIKGNYTYKVSCIRGCDMANMTYLPTRFILASNSKKQLKSDDFVIEISGGSPTQSTGRIVHITDEIIKRFNNKVICSNFCRGLRLKSKDYVSYFLQMWNMFYCNGVFFNFEGKTSGLKNFQFDTFVAQYWYFPPKEMAKKYHNIISKLQKNIDKNETEIMSLTALRDKLLPLLMNGQVEVA
ncbi:MAG: restriction endonuclease subunit S [Alphaproteobacteria bacterium]|nr:restriction endonuclease subunit S [Alphaproteobacteria bacterium]